MRGPEGGALTSLRARPPPPRSGPGWREPGAVWGDDRADDREAGAAVQRLRLLLRRRGLPLARGPDRLVSGRPSRGARGRGGAGPPGSPWPGAARLTGPSGSPMTLPGAAMPTTAATGVWRSWAANPSWKGISSPPAGTASSAVRERPWSAPDPRAGGRGPGRKPLLMVAPGSSSGQARPLG